MSLQPHSSNNLSHLTNHQRQCIIDDLRRKKTPNEIQKEWDVSIHNREKPSLKTIYQIRKEMRISHKTNHAKSGPKSRLILTPLKLEEINLAIEEDRFITLDSLAGIVNIPRTTCHLGIKLLKLKKFNALETAPLSESHIIDRITFCSTYCRWNLKPQMSIWWSDECIFKVEELFNYHQQTYYAQENLHLKTTKQFRKSSVNIWAAIRGDGKVLFKVLAGIQNTDSYLEMLEDMMGEMDQDDCFFMQDGAGHHTSNNAINWLNRNWKDRWIGLKSQRLKFPALSPDLTPLDFSFWHYVKFHVAKLRPSTRVELIDSIETVINQIPDQIVVSMCQAVKEKCKKCIQSHGQRFEE